MDCWNNVLKVSKIFVMSSSGCSNISFKVYLEHLSLVRKISVENTGLSYEVLRQRVQGLVSTEQELDPASFLLQYIDDDGDRITVGGDEELKQMLIEMVKKKKIYTQLQP